MNLAFKHLLPAMVVLCLLSTASFAGTDIPCAGDDFAFFQEIKDTNGLGLGEAWDMSHCANGQDMAIGTNESLAERQMKRQAALQEKLKRRQELQRLRAASAQPKKPPVDPDFYAQIFPLALGGTVVLVVTGVILMWFFRRLFGRTFSKDVHCRGCSSTIPIRLGQRQSVNTFCPACGQTAVYAKTGMFGEMSVQVRDVGSHT